MYNVSARGVTVPNAVIGMACFVGGLAQFAAGMWGMSLIRPPKNTVSSRVWSKQSLLLATGSARLVSIVLFDVLPTSTLLLDFKFGPAVFLISFLYILTPTAA